MHVDGLSPAANVALARWEARRGALGATSASLDAYRAFLRRPGRLLYPDADEYVWLCCTHRNVQLARDQLDHAVAALPAFASRQLRGVLRPLDVELRRRTLPMPPAWPTHPGLEGNRWWHRILGH